MTLRRENEWQTKPMTDLFRVISTITSPSECAKFFRDIATISELEALSERWQVARLLNDGISYRKISVMTGASTATVTRVAHWLHHGEGGYRNILQKK